MKKLVLFPVIFLSFLFSAWGQNQNIPEWVLNPPFEGGTIFGIGHSNLTNFIPFITLDDKTASRIAEEKAIVSVAIEIQMAREVFFSSLLTNENNPLSPELEFNENRKTVALDLDISDIITIKLEKMPDGIWWCLAVYLPGINDSIEMYKAFKAAEEAIRMMDNYLKN